MATYSFLDVQASMAGPTGVIDLGCGSGAAQEGITVSYIDDKGAMVVGADGNVMHSLRATQAGTITVRLLQTSPTNNKLSLMYAAQTVTSALFGRNTITIRHTVNGDVIVATQCAFKKYPDVTYAQDGGTCEWVFNCGSITTLQGATETLGITDAVNKVL